jgi:hypothetical protein
MAISETVLKDTVLMAIDEINAKGGVMGKKLEPVIVDPASNWPLFAEKTKQLLDQDKVSVIFGCWTSVSRKSVLPVVEEMNGLLFYPVQYEGEELSKNVFYTGAAPNQQAIPAVDYLMGNLSLPYNRLVIIGFAAVVLLGVALLISRTRLGLFVRGVTQNRPIASCMGVNTARIDTYAFALGSGIAGLAKIAVLVFIIIFIQKRPQGIFAMKGRSAEA